MIEKAKNKDLMKLFISHPLILNENLRHHLTLSVKLSIDHSTK